MFNNPIPGLARWVESETLYSGKYYTRLLVSSAQTNVDAIISPKGSGAFSLQQADGTATGGETRGLYAVDLSLGRANPQAVASGYHALNNGFNGKANNDHTVNLAYYGVASGIRAFNAGASGYSTGLSSFNTASGGTSSGDYSFNSGYRCSSIMYGESTHGSGYFTTSGDAQRRELIVRANTTDTTPVNLTSDGSISGTLNQLVLQNNQSVTAQVLVVAKKSGTTASTAHFRLTVCASRGTSAGTIVLHTTPVIETLWNPDSAVIAVTADTSNGAITFTITTPAGNWHTVADVFAISTIFA